MAPETQIELASELRSLLAGGDRRSIGRSGEAVEWIRRSPAHARAAVSAIDDPDAVVRLRSADALEKASRREPAILAEHRTSLLKALEQGNQPDVEWHLLQMVPRLRMTSAERKRAFDQARERLQSRSAIVAAEALSALLALSAELGPLRVETIAAAESALDSPFAAVRARPSNLIAHEPR